MRNVSAYAEQIKPKDIFAYIDHVHVTVMGKPLSKQKLTWLQSQCGKGGLYIDWPVIEGTPRQVLQLRQPTREAIQSLATIDHKINYIELALDSTFDRLEDVSDYDRFVHQYHVKPHHRGQLVCYIGFTRCSGPLSSPMVFVHYADRPCKLLKDEMPCLHIEMRLKGERTLRREGFVTCRDLLNLDYRSFWLKHMTFAAFNLREFGRQYNIHIAGKGYRPDAWVTDRSGYAYDKDLRAAATICRVTGSGEVENDGQGRLMQASLQPFVDDYRQADSRTKWMPGSVQAVIDTFQNRIPRIKSFLLPINVRHLLPTKSPRNTPHIIMT